MAQLSKGTTFSSGGTVTDANLNAHVDDATLLVGAITDQTAETTVADDDQIIFSDTSASALRRATRANFTGVTQSLLSTSVGVDALSNPSGSENTAFGKKALEDCGSGGQNTALGSDSLLDLTTGSYNTAVGNDSAFTLTTGSQNTCLGHNARTSANSSTNQTVLGHNAIGQGDNIVVLGDSNVVNINPGSDGSCDLGSSSQRFQDIYATNHTIQTSDGRLKEDVQPSALSLDFINALRPVSYKFVEKDETHYGLIAQEVKEAIGDKEFGGIVHKDDFYGLRYTEFIAPLIAAVQELSKRVEELENGG